MDALMGELSRVTKGSLYLVQDQSQLRVFLALRFLERHLHKAYLPKFLSHSQIARKLNDFLSG